jgi:thiosulfate/3-mercaptopyruvate sulfurtransferase
MTFTTLIQPAQLQTLLDAGTCCVIDCRHDLTQPDAGETVYANGHIPGAHFLHLDRDLSGAKNGRNGRHPLPDAAMLAAKLGQLGVHGGQQVVAYDDSGGMFAARLWWLLRWLGHGEVAVLDGGLTAWTQAGLPVSIDRPVPTAADFPHRIALPVITADQLLQQLSSPQLALIDARAPDRFRGENETLDPVAGHIPGARNRFFRDNLDATGRFKPATQLHAEFSQLLQDRAGAPVIHQCGSGVTACHNLLAMEIAGLHGSVLYAGSWSEWCSDPARPMVTG